MKRRKKKISRIVTTRLIAVVAAAYFLSAVLLIWLLFQKTDKNTREELCELIDYYVNSFETEFKPSTISALGEFYAGDCLKYDDAAEWTADLKKDLEKNNTFLRYVVADKDGRIIFDTREALLGMDIGSVMSLDALEKLKAAPDGSARYEKGELGMDENDLCEMIYGFMLSEGERYEGILLLGCEPETSQNFSLNYARSIILSGSDENRGNLVIFVDKDLKIINGVKNADIGKDISVTGIDIDPGHRYSKEISLGYVYDAFSYIIIDDSEGVYYIFTKPFSDSAKSTMSALGRTLLVMAGVFLLQFVILHILIKKLVVKKIEAVNSSLDKITGGDLEERIEVRDTYEFDSLSDDINATVDRLKEYIAEAAARIDADLAVAKAIQSSALPSVFPPFPERKEFELFADMNAAKEVGGDFYDFYMLGENTLGFLIADVSGKSIPGAMFMMTSKTVIKNLAESGMPPAEVFTEANEKLSEGNDAEMFVTAWLGYLDLKTGLVRVANAGHNPPVLIRGGKAEYVILKPGLMLAGMDGVRYKEQTVQLEKGDILYLYTDGVTEAMDNIEEQYGEERLKKLLSFGENYPEPSAENGIAETICETVTADIRKFTNGAEQSDDITMLCIRYLGGE